MLYIDDKARGVHEGYLVTPITKLELVFGLNMSGAIKATLSGICLTVIGSLMAGLGIIFHPWVLLQLLALILGTSIAFNGMMFLLMVRVEDPLTPRAMFGVLNLLLFYPSGAMYPIASFPWWLRAISVDRPFHLCHPRLQSDHSQRRRLCGDSIRLVVSLCLRNRNTAHRHAAVQAHAVTHLFRQEPYRRWLYTEPMMRRFFASSLLVILMLAGCHSGQKPPSQQPNARASWEFNKVYHLRGKVVSTDAAKGEVTLDHEAIPGFMEAMTMPYKLTGCEHPERAASRRRDYRRCAGLAGSGCGVAARPYCRGGAGQAGLHTYGFLSCAGTGRRWFRISSCATRMARPIHLGQFKGKALVVTFIYTRCPSPEFCPRVTRNFAELEKHDGGQPRTLCQVASALGQL